jgi:hypothetical protein
MLLLGITGFKSILHLEEKTVPRGTVANWPFFEELF